MKGFCEMAGRRSFSAPSLLLRRALLSPRAANLARRAAAAAAAARCPAFSSLARTTTTTTTTTTPSSSSPSSSAARFSAAAPPPSPPPPAPSPQPPTSWDLDTAWFRSRSPEGTANVLAWLRAENAAADAALADTAGLQARLFREMQRHLGSSPAPPPERVDDHWYYSRYADGQNFPVFFRRPVATSAGSGSSDGRGGGEQLILDPNVLGADDADAPAAASADDWIRVGDIKLSATHRFLGYTFSADPNSDAAFDVCVREPDSGVEHGPVVRDVASFDWGRDAVSGRDVLYYTRADALGRPCRVFRKALTLGPYDKGEEEEDEEELLFHEPDDAHFVDVLRTKDRAFVCVSSNSKTSSEVWAARADDRHAPLVCVTGPRTPGVQYFCDHAGDRFFAVTNRGGSNVFRLFALTDHDLASSSPSTAAAELEPADGGDRPWRRVVSVLRDPGRGPAAVAAAEEQEEEAEQGEGEEEEAELVVDIEDVDVFERFVAVFERHNGAQRVRLLSRADGEGSKEAAAWQACEYVPPAGTVVEPGSNQHYAADKLRLQVSSPLLATPATIDVDMADGAAEPPPFGDGGGGGSSNRAIAMGAGDAVGGVRCHVVHAGDDGRVPVTLLHRDDIALDGSNPLLLHGYGAYGSHLETQYCAARMALLRRGWVVALAHVRGGGELGKPWHDAGRLDRKEQSFADFVSCARALVDRGYSCPSRMCAHGMSAGGMLLGVVANRHPGLFRAMVMKVPFVDVLTTMSDATLPLTVHEYDEWGDPSRDPAVREYMRGYSPCDNVLGGGGGGVHGGGGGEPYPHMLVTASTKDARVGYWEPAKWVSRVRQYARTLEEERDEAGATAAKRRQRMLLLRTDEEGGHFGSGGRYGRLEDAAVEFAFLHKALGLPLH